MTASFRVQYSGVIELPKPVWVANLTGQSTYHFIVVYSMHPIDAHILQWCAPRMNERQS